jgi:hypothetical protein
MQLDIEAVMFAPLDLDDDNVPVVTIKDVIAELYTDTEVAESDDYILDGE